MRIRLYGRVGCGKCETAHSELLALLEKIPAVEFEYKDIDKPEYMAAASDHDAGTDLPVMVFMEHSKFDTSDVVRVFRGLEDVRAACKALVLELK